MARAPRPDNPPGGREAGEVSHQGPEGSLMGLNAAFSSWLRGAQSFATTTLRTAQNYGAALQQQTQTAISAAQRGRDSAVPAGDPPSLRDPDHLAHGEDDHSGRCRDPSRLQRGSGSPTSGISDRPGPCPYHAGGSERCLPRGPGRSRCRQECPGRGAAGGPANCPGPLPDHAGHPEGCRASGPIRASICKGSPPRRRGDPADCPGSLPA